MTWEYGEIELDESSYVIVRLQVSILWKSVSRRGQLSIIICHTTRITTIALPRGKMWLRIGSNAWQKPYYCESELFVHPYRSALYADLRIASDNARKNGVTWMFAKYVGKGNYFQATGGSTNDSNKTDLTYWANCWRIADCAMRMVIISNWRKCTFWVSAPPVAREVCQSIISIHDRHSVETLKSGWRKFIDGKYSRLHICYTFFVSKIYHDTINYAHSNRWRARLNTDTHYASMGRDSKFLLVSFLNTFCRRYTGYFSIGFIDICLSPSESLITSVFSRLSRSWMWIKMCLTVSIQSSFDLSSRAFRSPAGDRKISDISDDFQHTMIVWRWFSFLRISIYKNKRN